MNHRDTEIITFDCYGTLIDWEGGIVGAFQREAARDQLNFNGSDIVAAYMAEEPAVEAESYRSYREVLAQTAVRAARRLGWQIDLNRARFLPESLPSWRPFADTNAALERLKRKFRLGILSNIDNALLTETRRHFTVDFDLIVTAQDVGSYKPAQGHFREAVARGVKADKWLHAAQSYFHDVVPCRALNIPVAWVNRKAESVPPQGVRPTYEVSDLTELADLLEA